MRRLSLVAVVGLLMTTLMSVAAWEVSRSDNEQIVGPAAVPGNGNPSTVIGSGTVLGSGSEVFSPNGQYRLAMQTDGNLVLYQGSQWVWKTTTNGNPGAWAVMQVEGNLVVYSASGQALWATPTHDRPGSDLHVQDDGNLAIYDGNDLVSWDRFGGTRPNSVVDTGVVLQGGESRWSPNGQYRLAMQTDGNLVLYQGSQWVWKTTTNGNPGAWAVMQVEGNLVVYSASGQALWATPTADRPGSELYVQDDGNLVLYDGNGHEAWNRFDGVVAAPEPGLFDDGECVAVKLGTQSTSIVWENPPANSWLWAEDRTEGDDAFQNLMDLVDGNAVYIDLERDWGAAEPDYRVQSFDRDTAVLSEWVTCVPVTFSPVVASSLTEAGVPVLPSGQFGSSNPGGVPNPVSFPGNAVKNTPVSDAPSVCSGGGLLMDVPAVGGDIVSGFLKAPAGVEVRADWMFHKSVGRNGAMAGHYQVFERNEDGTAGSMVASGGAVSKYSGWSPPGDRVGFDDKVLFTSSGNEYGYIIQLEHSSQSGSVEVSDGAHYRMGDFKFTIGETETQACPPPVSECGENGGNNGNFFVHTAFNYNGLTYGPGCYNRVSCVADMAPILKQISEFGCENDEMLDVLLAAGLVVLVGSTLVIGGPIAAGGAAVGLVTSLWSCDTSENGSLTPATSLGSLDSTCVATNVAISTIASSFGVYYGSAGASTTFGRAVAVSCGIGGAEGAVATTAIGYVRSDQNVDVTDAAIATALGCTTGGSAGGTTKATRNIATNSQVDDIIEVSNKWIENSGSTVRKPDFSTDVTRSTFERELAARGFTSVLRSADKNIVEWSLDGKRYVVRDFATSTGEPAVDVYAVGATSITLKIRLEP